MTGVYQRIVKALMVLSFAVLPGSFIECDLEDGELEVDLDEIEWLHHHDDDEMFVDVWYDDCCYDCWCY